MAHPELESEKLVGTLGAAGLSWACAFCNVLVLGMWGGGIHLYSEELVPSGSQTHHEENRGGSTPTSKWEAWVYSLVLISDSKESGKFLLRSQLVALAVLMLIKT